MNIAAIHEGGHIVVLYILGYEGVAQGTQAATFSDITDEIHLAAISLGGALAELLHKQPQATLREAHRWAAESGRVSAGDWSYIVADYDKSYAGLKLAHDILVKNRGLFLSTAEWLNAHGSINTIEMKICQEMETQHASK